MPLEVFSETWTQDSQLLPAEAAATATFQRIEFNRSQKCDFPVHPSVSPVHPIGDPRALEKPVSSSCGI